MDRSGTIQKLRQEIAVLERALKRRFILGMCAGFPIPIIVFWVWVALQ